MIYAHRVKVFFSDLLSLFDEGELEKNLLRTNVEHATKLCFPFNTWIAKPDVDAEISSITGPIWKWAHRVVKEISNLTTSRVATVPVYCIFLF